MTVDPDAYEKLSAELAGMNLLNQVILEIQFDTFGLIDTYCTF